jgi:hypothetical protein
VSTGRFINLPEEFCPPERAARHIADLNTLAEREAYWVRIPRGGWQAIIGHFAVLFIAARIVDMPEKVARQNALASVPDFWRDDVKAHVLRLWQTKELREQYLADQAAKRERAAA